MLKIKKKYGFTIAIAILVCIVILFVFKNMSYNNIPKLNIVKTGSHYHYIDKITLSIDNIETQDIAAVYKMKPLKLNEEEQKIEKAFGLSNIDFKSNENFINIEDEMHIKGAAISLEENGYWSYTTDLAFYTGENLPTKDEALEIADRFMKENDIFPIEKLGNPTISELTSGDGIFEPMKVLAWDVCYYPKVNNYGVYGVYRINISIGSNGEIVGVNKLANDYELVENVNLKDYRQINLDFESGDFSFSGEVESDNAILSNIEIKYYVEPDGEYIQPIYVISDENSGAEIILDAQDRTKD